MARAYGQEAALWSAGVILFYMLTGKLYCANTRTANKPYIVDKLPYTTQHQFAYAREVFTKDIGAILEEEYDELSDEGKQQTKIYDKILK